MKNKTKIFFIITIVSIVLLLIVKIFAIHNKEVDKKNNQVANQYSKVFISQTVKPNELKELNNHNEIQKIKDIIEILYAIKENKNTVYQLRRKIEKQDFFNLISNKESFKEIMKSLEYTSKQQTIIKQKFENEEEFLENMYKFYLYLIISQIDENKILQLKEQMKFIKQKIYKVDPEVIENLKSKHDPQLDTVLQEIEKNLYQPNLSQQKKEALFNELKKINYILAIYENVKNNEGFIWIYKNREKILNSLKL